MKIVCNALELAAALNTVSKAIPQKKSLDILEYIKLSAFDNQITLTASDQELTLSKQLSAEIKEEGVILIAGRLFADVVRGLSAVEEITLYTKDDETVVLEYNCNETVIKGYPADEYPTTTPDKEEYSLSLPQAKLKDLIIKTIFATAKLDSRPILKGCYFEIDGSTLTVVALDGVKLARVKEALDMDYGKFSFIVPQRSLNELKNILSDSSELVTLSIGSKKLVTSVNSCNIITRLLEGNYVNYSGIIPSSYENKVIIDRLKLLESLGRAEIISKELNNNTVEFTVSEANLNIYAISENGQVNENIEIDSSNTKDLKISVNVRYMIDILSVIKEGIIVMELKNSTSPLIIKDVEDKKYLFLVLPIRVQSNG